MWKLLLLLLLLLLLPSLLVVPPCPTACRTACWHCDFVIYPTDSMHINRPFPTIATATTTTIAPLSPPPVARARLRLSPLQASTTRW